MDRTDKKKAGFSGSAYRYYKTFDGLVDLVTRLVAEIDTGAEPSLGFRFSRINFRVSGEAPSGSTQSALKKAYMEADGTYGITTIDPFDQDVTTVVMGYYAVGQWVRTFSVHRSSDRDAYLSTLRKEVWDCLSGVMCGNCDGVNHAYWVQVER